MLIHRIAVSSAHFLLLGLAVGYADLTVASTVFAADVAPVKLLDKLKAPSGVAVRPAGANEPPQVFVADRGAGRIVKVIGALPDSEKEVIAGFPEATAPDNTSVSPGIRSLIFLDRMRLVVAGADTPQTPFLRLYDLPESNAPLQADQQKQAVDLPRLSDEPKTDQHSFHDLVRTIPNEKVADSLVVAASGAHAGLWKVALHANTLGDISELDADNSDDRVAAATGVAISNRGYVVVAEAAATDSGGAGSIKYVNPIDGHVALQIKTELQHIAALAYSPSTGNLYAVNSASRGKQSDGVYRIDDAGELGKPACTAIKIADIARPTALAFGADGTLYVTALGDKSESDKGSLLKLTGEL